MRYTEEIDAKVTITARLGADGDFSAKAAAVCDYQPGATASAEIELPESAKKAIRAAFQAGIKDVEEELGKRLAQSRHEAHRVAAAMGEVPGQAPARSKATAKRPAAGRNERKR